MVLCVNGRPRILSEKRVYINQDRLLQLIARDGMVPKCSKYENDNTNTAFPVIMSQLHGSEAEGPIIPYLYGVSGSSAWLPCSCDVITGDVKLAVNPSELPSIIPAILWRLVFVKLSRRAHIPALPKNSHCTGLFVAVLLTICRVLYISSWFGEY